MTFRQHLLSGRPLVGTFIKTPNRIVTEVLATTPLDVLCLDAEHAPFDRDDLDGSVFAARAHNMPCLVRIAEKTPSHILNALDIGASGIVAPHIRSGEEAEALVKASLFGPGGRGYAGSTRAAGYTKAKIPTYKVEAAEQTAIVAQLEDLEAVEAINEVVQVSRVDCLFIGRIDLAVSLGADNPNATEVIDAVDLICAKATEAGRRVGMFVSDLSEIPRWLDKGVNFFLLSSDHGFLIDGAARLHSNFMDKVS